mgnify:CR=1 FL=1
MSNIHGKNCFIAVEDSTSASRNLSGDGNSVTLTESVANPEITGFSDGNVQRAGSGLTDSRFSIEGWSNDAANTNLAVLSALKNACTMICFAPNGSGATASPVKYTACVILDDYEINAPVAGISTYRVTFSQSSGSLTKSTSWATLM